LSIYSTILALSTYNKAVESLGTSVEGNIILLSGRVNCFFVNALKRIAAASLPMLKAGWVIVVSEGFNRGAVSRLEKLIIFTSRGMDNLR